MVKPLAKEAEENKILYVFIIIDKAGISNISKYEYNRWKIVDNEYEINELFHERWKSLIGNQKLFRRFPIQTLCDYKSSKFNNYFEKDAHELNKVLVDILRQFYDLRELWQ